MNDMVDAVIFALGEYYRHAGINEINLANLLKHFRSDYALLTNEKFDQNDGSRKIIETCMTQLMLAPMRSDNKLVLVDLGKPDVNYEEVWTRVLEEENEYHAERKGRIHKECRENGVAKCRRMFESDWLARVTDEEKQNMSPNECLCEKVRDRKIRMLCDFKIDDSGEPVFIEL